METKSRYEVIADLENTKRELIQERDNLEAELNELKNRTCEGCKYMTIEHQSKDIIIGTCKKGTYDKQLSTLEDYILGDFCCNRWEKKI